MQAVENPLEYTENNNLWEKAYKIQYVTEKREVIPLFSLVRKASCIEIHAGSTSEKMICLLYALL